MSKQKSFASNYQPVKCIFGSFSSSTCLRLTNRQAGLIGVEFMKLSCQAAIDVGTVDAHGTFLPSFLPSLFIRHCSSVSRGLSFDLVAKHCYQDIGDMEWAIFMKHKYLLTIKYAPEIKKKESLGQRQICLSFLCHEA